MEFNFAIPISKSANTITGIASTVSIDSDNQRMSDKALKSMVNQFKSTRINVFEDHDHKVENTLGFVKDVTLEDNKVKVEIDLENPEWNSKTNLIMKKLEHGTQLGLSVGGKIVGQPRVVKDGNKSVEVIDDVKLHELSIVGIPANPDSLIDIPGAIFKSMKAKCPNCGSQDIKPSKGDDYHCMGCDRYFPKKEIEKKHKCPRCGIETEDTAAYCPDCQYESEREEKSVKKADVDPNELEMGIKVEMEHTDNPDEAKRIALEHLKETPDYYSKLKSVVGKGLNTTCIRVSTMISLSKGMTLDGNAVDVDPKIVPTSGMSETHQCPKCWSRHTEIAGYNEGHPVIHCWGCGDMTQLDNIGRAVENETEVFANKPGKRLPDNQDLHYG